ncbi:unnamed protein product [Rangifer tarandus platyrhynchus]|uniref:Uncharacterized protein n=1 Tax=Rangifer tarandus platyrhynchus TaxID=3082113 RepID=A0AC60A9K7_RANTA
MTFCLILRRTLWQCSIPISQMSISGLHHFFFSCRHFPGLYLAFQYKEGQCHNFGPCQNHVLSESCIQVYTNHRFQSWEEFLPLMSPVHRDLAVLQTQDGIGVFPT